MGQAEIRLEEEGRIGPIDLEPQLHVGDVGNERCGADGIAKHCENLLTLW